VPPEPVSSPTRRFVVTRIDAGVETNVIASNPLGPNYTTDQVVRAQTYDNVRTWLAANPGVHLRIYSPANNGVAHTDDDCIWDSTLNSELPI
jgi:hypothetical protein